MGAGVEVRVVQGVHADDLLAGKLLDELVDLLVELVLAQLDAVAPLDGLDANFSVAADLLLLVWVALF